MNKKKLTFGIVGIGYWGKKYLRILQELNYVQLTWICDTERRLLKQVKSVFPKVKLTSDFQKLLNDKNLDCIAVVTPPGSHYVLIKQSLLAGKHVLSEKPFTLNFNEASELVTLAKNKKLSIGIDHTYMFNPGIKKLKEIIDSKELGKIYYSYGVYNAFGPIPMKVSVLWELSVHFISVMNFLLKSYPEYVSAMGKSYLKKGIEDIVFANFEYPGNVIFNLNTSWLNPSKTRKIVIVGSEKMAVFDDMTEGKLKICNLAAKINKSPGLNISPVVIKQGDISTPKIENKEPLKEMIADFVLSIANNQTPFSSGTEGLDIVNILAHAERSIHKNGERIKIIRNI